MSGYTKLFASIVGSTVWRESHTTRIVWITMLAMCDADGLVEASVPGLAHLAGVTLEECEEALACFLAPDTYSRSKEHDGRRIAEAQGGWVVLNRRKYRDDETLAQQKARSAERSARYRERHAASRCDGVTGHVTSRDNHSDRDRVREEKKAEKRDGHASSALLVWEHWLGLWRSNRGKGVEPKFTPDRKRLLAARLSEGLTVEQLQAAATGLWSSEWHREQGQINFELCYRKAGQVEKYEAKTQPELPMVQRDTGPTINEMVDWQRGLKPDLSDTDTETLERWAAPPCERPDAIAELARRRAS